MPSLRDYWRIRSSRNLDGVGSPEIPDELPNVLIFDSPKNAMDRPDAPLGPLYRPQRWVGNRPLSGWRRSLDRSFSTRIDAHGYDVERCLFLSPSPGRSDRGGASSIRRVQHPKVPLAPKAGGPGETLFLN